MFTHDVLAPLNKIQKDKSNYYLDYLPKTVNYILKKSIKTIHKTYFIKS